MARPKLLVIKSTEGRSFYLMPALLLEDSIIPYIANRHAIRRAFLGDQDLKYIVGLHTPTDVASVRFSADRVDIGCQTFVGASYRALYKWAINQ